MTESPVDLLRRAAETLWPASDSVLPSGISAIVYDYLIECADAVERGSTPQGLAEAEEVLALAEQQQAASSDTRKVLEYVSRGRRYVDVEPYPDAQARRALGALMDAEQLPAQPIEVRVYQARGIRPDSWLHEDRFTEFRHAYSYASVKTHAIPGLSKISAEEAYYVHRIIQHGFEFNERTKGDPRLGIEEAAAEEPEEAWGEGRLLHGPGGAA